MHQTHNLEAVIHDDMTRFIRDLMTEHKANNLYTKKVDDIQSSVSTY